MKYNIKGIKMQMGTQKTGGRYAKIGTWYTTLLLCALALLIAGCADAPNAQIDITAPEPIIISSSDVEVSASSVTVHWSPSPSDDVVEVHITCTPNNGIEQSYVITDNSTSATITELTPNTDYLLSVIVIDAAGNASSVVEIYVTTSLIDTEPPSSEDDTPDAVDPDAAPSNIIDADGDGLIDISSLERLNTIRYNLDLSDGHYKTSDTDSGIMCGAAADTACSGYELTQDLDFANSSSYDSGIINDGWRPAGGDSATNSGWEPIGDATNSFATVFDGNGYTISNLYARRAGSVGLFGYINSSATIRGVGIVGGSLYGGSGHSDFVGGLVGYNDGGTITASYAIGTADGGDGNYDGVGGLVGWNTGSINASYATGDVDGGDGNNDRVGGLVGYNDGGTITASYATGTVDGGTGDYDGVGGLVGYNNGIITASYATGNADGGEIVGGLVGYNNSIITASYATGTADGGDDNGIDLVGGLAGYNGGAITASYATGDADGGDGNNDRVGGLAGLSNGTVTVSYATGTADGGGGTGDSAGALVGWNPSGTITASYGFGLSVHGEIYGTDDSGDRPNDPSVAIGTGRTGAALLLAPDPSDSTNTAVSATWNQASSTALSAWGFGTTTEIPVLRYADYDGSGTVYGCSSTTGSTATIPATVPNGRGGITSVICGTTLLPGQTPSVDPVRIADPNPDSRPAPSSTPVDVDGDGLIDINSLNRLYNMRYNLTGTSYKTSSDDSGVLCGTAGTTTCSGYELTQNLDFASASSYDSNSINSAWRPNAFDPDDATNSGWEPIGGGRTSFATVFEGNGYTISNLYSRRSGHVGLFGQTGSRSTIRTVGIVDGFLYGSSDNMDLVGSLVGHNHGGTITASYATGDVNGGGGDHDSVGGLVGHNYNGTITASYATGDADGGNGTTDYVGGLVGWNSGVITASHATGNTDGGNGAHDYVGGLVGYHFRLATITASYATGDADGGNGYAGRVGGLVGNNHGGTITASYATGDADGGDGLGDYIGGLVGYNNDGTIITSYATGDADGGNGDSDRVGGLVGYNRDTITASYATGSADGGTGINDRVGSLAGYSSFDTTTASYGFGSSVNGEINGTDGSGDRPDGVGGVGSGPNGARFLSAANTPTAWNSAASSSMNAWKFGTTTEIPTLRYADYDGSRTRYRCGTAGRAAIPAIVPDGNGGTTTVICGSTLLPGQTPAVDPALIADLVPDPAPLPSPSPVDADGDGLIDINSLDRLYNMRYNLTGTSYKTSSDDSGILCGTAGTTTCSGYELTQNLDFASASSYDSNSINSAWRPNAFDPDDATNRGWDPIGDTPNVFATVFEGNGYTISNLYVRRVGSIGLFGRTSHSATIRTVGIVDGSLYGSRGHGGYVGGLVGWNDGGTITASYATGDANGGGLVGGLVGQNNGTITASYATGDADGIAFVGGLVGYNNSNGTITASHASGDVDGGDNTGDYVGGLVGYNNVGTISTSYATGDASGGDGDYSYVGGLVGYNWRGTITDSYATGTADGGIGEYNHVGGLVGYNDGTIIASYATGDIDEGNTLGPFVGGLVGYNNNSTIIASYATGDVDGGDGDYSYVGGLVGYNWLSTTTATYASGDVDGGRGNSDRVGGLIGGNHGGTITASYATGDVDGGGGNSDMVGGLLGLNDRAGRSLVASYATGDVDGGEGSGDFVGGLVGHNNGTLIASYGFGSSVNGEFIGIDDSGDRPSGVAGVGSGPNGARFLTAANTPAAWNSVASNSTNAWKFGTTTEIPTLRYADYDGSGSTYSCRSGSTTNTGIPATVSNGRGGTIRVICGTTLLPGQTPAVDPALIVDPVPSPSPVDADGDGLIDIDTLVKLHNMRYNLAGTSYKTSSSDSGILCGTAGTTICSGYEITQNLDFDRDGGGTYNRTTYALDAGDHHATYFPVAGNGTGGWRPIGHVRNPFNTIFEGNGFYIRGLAVRRTNKSVGMFAYTGSNAIIRNIGLTDNLADYMGSSNKSIFIGGLVGQNSGTITNSYATGAADGGNGNTDYVGVLVGYNYRGTITNSYATGAADGRDGSYHFVGGLVGANSSTITASYATGNAYGGDDGAVGGLVGWNEGIITASYAAGDVTGSDSGDAAVGGLVGQSYESTIIASYATGDANGSDGDGDYIGGLVGYSYSRSTIIASYATGDANGGGGDDYVGGLVGHSLLGTVTASYATGDANGGSGSDYVGGLVGYNYLRSTVTVSYATGNADGGTGGSDYVGGLVGHNYYYSTVTTSYGFGSSVNGEVAGIDDSGDRPSGVGVVGSGTNGARLLTSTNTPTAWNSAASNSMNAWNFGTTSQAPALRYADYDGSGTAYSCSTLPATVPNGAGGTMTVVCGTTLLPGQR